jgi:aspartyl protease family protein
LATGDRRAGVFLRQLQVTMLSSGHRTFLIDVASWAFFAGVAVVGVTHIEEITAIAHRVAGTDPAMLEQARSDTNASTRGTEKRALSTGGLMVELPVGADGHYHAEAEVNGQPVQVLVDTGASVVALTAEDADAAGIYVSESDFTAQIQTANGVARVAPVVFDEVRIGDIRVRNVRGIVSEPGALGVSLLGMTFLSELERVDMRSGKLILEE